MRDEPTTGLPTSDLGGHKDNVRAEVRICPFLRAVHGGNSLGEPIGRPDQANRCTALGDAAPQSLRKQELACLSSAHVQCPRFVRGAMDSVEPPAPVERPGFALTPAIIGALLVLAASFALSVGFVVANGGMDLSSVSSGGPQPAVVSAAPSPSSSSEASSAASAEPSASMAPSAEPSLAATPAPSLTVTAAPTVAPTARPTSDRYALLEPCPDAPDCWIYVVRSGDNLVSIARYFGVPFEVVTELNPWTGTTRLVAGQELRLPPPTR